MAVIQETISIIDEFTGVFLDFISGCTDAAKSSEVMADTVVKVNDSFIGAASGMDQASASQDHWTSAVAQYNKEALEMAYTTEELVEMGYKTSSALDEVATSALDVGEAVETSEKQVSKAASNGYNRLFNKVLSITAAYLSLKSILGSISKGLKLDTFEVRFKALMGDDVGAAAMSWVKDFSRQVARPTDEMAKAMTDYTNITGKPANLTGLMQLTDKLAVLNGKDFGATAAAIKNSMLSGQARSIASQLGIGDNHLKQFKVMDFAKSGDVSGFIDALNKAAEAAGKTEKAYNRMLNTPQKKWDRFRQSLSSGAERAGQAFINSFAPAFEKFNTFIESDRGERFFNTLERAMDTAGRVAGWLVDNLEAITAVLGGVVAALAMYQAVTGIMNVVKAIAMIPWQLLIVLVVISIVIALFLTWPDIVSGVCAVIGAVLWDLILFVILAISTIIIVIADAVLSIVSFIVGVVYVVKDACANIGTFFHNLGVGIQNIWYNIASFIIDKVKTIIDWINRIPGVSINTSGLSGVSAFLDKKKSELESQYKDYKNLGESFAKGMLTVPFIELDNKFTNGLNKLVVDPAKAWDKGKAWGADMGSKANKTIDDVKDIFGKMNGSGVDNLGKGIPKVGKVGSVGKIEKPVNLADEDIKMLVDIAERRRINQINLTQVTPNNTFYITQNQSQLESPEDLLEKIERVLSEQEGAYSEGAYT